MPTDKEIEAAVAAMSPLLMKAFNGDGTVTAGELAKTALEAAEKVRDKADSEKRKSEIAENEFWEEMSFMRPPKYQSPKEDK